MHTDLVSRGIVYYLGHIRQWQFRSILVLHNRREGPRSETERCDQQVLTVSVSRRGGP